MNHIKTTPKTTLVQSLEEIQEVNEMVAILKDYTNYINYINSSMVVPCDVLKGGDENPIAMFPDKPTLIKIDTTKMP